MCHDNEEWCKIWRGIDLLFQNWHQQFAVFLTRTLKSVKNLHFNGLLLNEVCNVWAKKSTEEWYLMALKIDAKFEGKLTCALRNDRNMKIFHRLKNSDFILEIKMAKSKWKFKRTRSTRCSEKTLFYLGAKGIAQLTKPFTHILQDRCS